ncbi:MAG TPA: alpha/beta hydrolase [Mycobacterium sp.]|uniref:alpha/beta fold hydrolase n=1 Tax=Mycobacterium sp. TaxID=1785 RepID=UPI002D70C703|nr:alpha/beta hydrolase [Mycobacterium sp.]HZU45670.1 alpha/beta hydrolase [Mycobacterium sp.]
MSFLYTASNKNKECSLDGRRVRYVDTGTGEPVLLLHGYPQSSSCWRHQIPALAAGYRVIAPDWPGYGHSEPPATPPTYHAEVERIGQLADHMGLDRFNLIAHDYGGFLGLGYVLRHPDRVLRLGLLNTRGHRVFRPWFYAVMLNVRWMATHRGSAAATRQLPVGQLHRLALRRYRKLGCFDTTLETEYLGWMDQPRGRHAFVEFYANYHLPQVPWLSAGLTQIMCPAAIIWGDRDLYIPFRTARELAERIPAATLTRLRGADHYVMEERPQDVTAALLELLARPTSPRL